MRSLSSALALVLVTGALAQTLDLKPVPSGMASASGGYSPIRLAMSAEKPAAIKKVPAGLTDVTYGVLTFGGKPFGVVIGKTAAGEPHIYVDSNGDGDLTNDAPAKWSPAAYSDQSGKQLTRYMGSAEVSFGVFKDASVNFYMFDPNDTARAALKNTLLYYADFYYQGTLKVGDTSMRTLLIDRSSSGEFKGVDVPAGVRGSSGLFIYIDKNGDGVFHPRAETFDARKPFAVNGVTLEFVPGATPKVIKSTTTVAEIPVPPDQSVGKSVINFAAKTTDGTEISFPTTFKGKIVMLDFWATWCGPCKSEIPGLVKAYEEFRSRGFEVLGISLDQENALQTLTDFTKEWKMPWKQVYDGKFWQADVAQKFSINAIPAAFLVDGDTGRILATGNSLRGASLIPTLEKALAAKNR